MTFTSSWKARRCSLFQYDPSYLAHLSAYPVDPSLELVSGTQQTTGLPGLLHAADVASRESSGTDGYDALKVLLDAGTDSLGGARPKASVLDGDGHQMIAKFPHPEDGWDVMAWEKTALDLADAAGISVPTRQLVRINDRHVLLLARFDRSNGGGRVGYCSAMTMLQLRDGAHGDYVDIVEILAEVSAQAGTDARALFSRVAVSVGLNNTDDHLRNHGFLRVRGGWALSPAFDVNPNPNAELRQTTIAGAGSLANEAEGLLELAKACRLSKDEARRELTRIADVVSHWREVATQNDVPRTQLTRFERSFETGIATLREA